MASTPAPEVLTRSQHARRARVIEAAMELAGEGGYDAVQMRDVAARAGVALGTVYRYFNSKDHLLASALLEWARGLESNLGARAVPAGDTPVDRIVAVIRRITRASAREPVLFAALVTAITAPDPSVSECQAEVQRIVAAVLSVPLHGVDDELREGSVRILAHVWFASLLGWVNGWTTSVGAVGDELEFAARLLLRHE
jgi:AcrR family transcriptional regulator